MVNKKINKETYSVEKFDKELNRMNIYVYLTEETKDKLRKHYFRELGRRDMKECRV